MSCEEMIHELKAALSHLEPNQVTPLSNEAGCFLLKIVKELKDRGEI